MTHAQLWPNETLCQAAVNGAKFGKGTTKRYDVTTITCEACRTLIVNEGTPRRNLLAEIKADMVKRNPRVADPEWATEGFVPR